MVVLNILIDLCLIAFQSGREIDATRFEKLMLGLHQTIKDITVACEGEIREGDGARSAGFRPDRLPREFQCRYWYRSDGAAFLEIYQRGLKGDDRRSHTLFENLSGISSVQAVPDLGRFIYSPARSSAAKTALRRPSPLIRSGCPDRILFLWYFQGLRDVRGMNYEFQGWEELGDHRCLRVELDSFAGARPENKNRIRFWIDMERGGHPLRVEQYRRGRLAMRYDHIKLQQFKDAKGFSIWLPVSGQVESFMGTAVRDGKREIAFHPKPVMVESYRVITGSVLINQGLRDTDLTLAANTSKFSDFGKFKGGEEERRRLFSIDPKAVQKRLDDALAEADSKARRLEASAPERANWDSSTLLSLGLPALGTALLCWAGIRKWRDR